MDTGPGDASVYLAVKLMFMTIPKKVETKQWNVSNG